jgi:hypothetical protein
MIVAIIFSVIVIAWLVDIACELVEAIKHPLEDDEVVDEEDVYSKY